MNCCTAQSSGADAPGPATTPGRCAVSELRGLLESPAGPGRARLTSPYQLHEGAPQTGRNEHLRRGAPSASPQARVTVKACAGARGSWI